MRLYFTRTGQWAEIIAFLPEGGGEWKGRKCTHGVVFLPLDPQRRWPHFWDWRILEVEVLSGRVVIPGFEDLN